jgi:hypothetical protein
MIPLQPVHCVKISPFDQNSCPTAPIGLLARRVIPVAGCCVIHTRPAMHTRVARVIRHFYRSLWGQVYHLEILQRPLNAIAPTLLSHEGSADIRS